MGRSLLGNEHVPNSVNILKIIVYFKWVNCMVRQLCLSKAVRNKTKRK